MDNSFEEFYKQYHLNLIVLFGFIVVIYIGIFTLFNNFTFNTPEARPWIFMIEVIMWALFILIIFLNVKYFHGFDIKFKDILYDLFGTKRTEMEVHVHKAGHVHESGSTVKKSDSSNNVVNATNDTNATNATNAINKTTTYSIDISNNCNNSPNSTKSTMSTHTMTYPIDEHEVFHIPQNKYGYEEASEICKLFDSRLATYDEIEEAYNKGANWCSYGWSSDQLALFPIQKTIYNELKKIPGHERDCGRTGVNGGYMDKNIKFGVNCYGKKPYAGEDDLEYMKKFTYSNAYPDEELKAIEKRNEKKNNLLVAPFNKEKWNE